MSAFPKSTFDKLQLTNLESDISNLCNDTFRNVHPLKTHRSKDTCSALIFSITEASDRIALKTSSSAMSVPQRSFACRLAGIEGAIMSVLLTSFLFFLQYCIFRFKN